MYAAPCSCFLCDLVCDATDSEDSFGEVKTRARQRRCSKLCLHRFLVASMHVLLWSVRDPQVSVRAGQFGVVGAGSFLSWCR
eukprot:3419539-Alexandrium_andersonii.AAC.1